MTEWLKIRMRIEIWDKEHIVFEGDLPEFELCGDLYITWQGEPMRVQNGREVWISGDQPSKRRRHTQPSDTSSKDDKSEVVPDLKVEKDLFFESLQEWNPVTTVKESTPPLTPSWDQSQSKVIRTSRSARMLVGAGPGTGKTAVACARVAFLITEQDCNPNGIFLVSFTRTAVAEIRARIASHLDDPFLSNSVRVLTLDSFAWSINSGFNEAATISAGYDGNITTATSMLLKHPLVHEYIQTVEHLVVDEAQDILGARASLVMALVGLLPEAAGVTIFSDDAQAIYGFSAKNGEQSRHDTQIEILPQLLRKSKNTFVEKNLDTIHRTTSSGLVTIFSEVRNTVLNNTEHSLVHYSNVCELIKKNSHTNDGEMFDPMHFAGEDNSFALFRWKREVLKAVDALGGKPHRIRMGGIANGVESWIGAVLGGLDLERLTKPEFVSLCEKRKIGFHFANLNIDEAWGNLISVAGARQRIELKVLRQNIASQNLPQHMLRHELGIAGPIVGTIHAAKGREADTVYLYFPRISKRHGTNIDFDEETRVMFVGATRPKKWLHAKVSFEDVGGGQKERTSRIWEYIPQKWHSRRVMFGQRCDISPVELVGKNIFENPEEAHTAQEMLLRIAAKIEKAHSPVSVFALFNGRRYELKTEDGHTICFLSDAVHTDLRDILKRVPQKIERLWLMDVGTVAIENRTLSTNELHAPWQKGGIMLCPRIIGYPELMAKGSK
ncbi:UvrD-helicase domain-containing protein [Desulfovibrio sp. QI0430]